MPYASVSAKHGAKNKGAADLCNAVGGENDIATCCAYMRTVMGLRDRIVENTTSEHGETLTVRYMLPHVLP